MSRSCIRVSEDFVAIEQDAAAAKAKAFFAAIRCVVVWCMLPLLDHPLQSFPHEGNSSF